MKIGERLASEMESRGISEGELGRRSGVNQPTIHRIITGESKNPRQDNVEKIAKALGHSANWLWSGEEKETIKIDEELKVRLDQAVMMFEELELSLHGDFLLDRAKGEGTAHLRSVTEQLKKELDENNRKFKETMSSFVEKAAAQASDFKFLEKIRKPRVLSIMIQISQAAAEDRLTDQDLDLLQAVIDRLSSSANHQSK